MLDAMDVLLYSFVLDDVRREFGISDEQSGLLLAAPLAASAVGGVLFGWVADRVGRTRALSASILVYSIATAACGFSQTAWQLGLCRIVLGLGMGGEWATGAALVAETWPDAHRGKALGFMQSAWAVGYAAAAAVYAVVQPTWGWRGVFLAGILPALLTFWIRRAVPESPLWAARHRGAPEARRFAMPAPLLRLACLVTLMNAATMFGWWGLFTWIPSYLSRSPADGGAGLSIVRTSAWVASMQVGMWLGYVSFGYLADAFGRRRAYVGFLLMAALLAPAYGATTEPRTLFLLGPVVAFFGTGYFSGFGAVTAEIFPTSIRATAQGLTYNIGRGVSALAPVTVGLVASRGGLGGGFMLTGAAFLVAALFWIGIPETRGRHLDEVDEAPTTR